MSPSTPKPMAGPETAPLVLQLAFFLLVVVLTCSTLALL
jgi:hypothetical protein